MLRAFKRLNIIQAQLRDVPNSVIITSIFMSASAIIQAVADFILESLSFAKLIPPIPFRFEFLILTAISALLGYQLLKGIERGELDVTQDAWQVSFCIEVGLILSDLYFLFTHPSMNVYLILIRLPFLILTSVNVGILLYIMYRLRLFQLTTLRAFLKLLGISFPEYVSVFPPDENQLKR